MGMIGQKQKNIQNRHRHQIGHPHGFTLVEIIVVIVIIAILAAVAIPSLVGYIDKSHRTHDLISLRTLNMGTKIYRVNEQIQTADVFQGITTDNARQLMLYEGQYIEEIMVPRTKNAKFSWYKSSQSWRFLDSQSPLGNNYNEIFPGIIQRIENYSLNPGIYGRTWGEYRYTDIGLDPEEWDEPVDHIHYKPAGGILRISPEIGYFFHFLDRLGTEKTLTYSSNWDLIYNVETDIWYHHSIVEGNQIDISSLEVVQD